MGFDLFRFLFGCVLGENELVWPGSQVLLSPRCPADVLTVDLMIIDVRVPRTHTMFPRMIYKRGLVVGAPRSSYSYSYSLTSELLR